ncbi:putative ribonuclease H-like domain-containing protein [Tanacetum coccineum]
MAFVSSGTNNSSNTNEGVNIVQGVSTTSTQVNTADINNLSDAIIYALLAGQSNNPQLLNEDLEQIHEDDLEEMDLKWLIAMLTMRARRFQRKIVRNLTIKGSETAGFDKSKVECYNCHKRGHFARECTALRNQDQRNRESTGRFIGVETSTDKDLVSCDGLGGRFVPPKLDLSYIGLEEFAEPTLKSYNDVPCDELPKNPKKEKITVKPSVVKVEVVKPKQQEKKDRKPVRVNTTSSKVTTAKPNAVVLNAVKGKMVNAVKASTCWVWRPKQTASNQGNPQTDLQDKGVIDSGCSRHMT